MDLLIRASLTGTVAVGAIWLVGRLLPLSPSVRATLWWCASLKFVLTLVWTAPVVLPLLPETAESRPAAVAGQAGRGTSEFLATERRPAPGSAVLERAVPWLWLRTNWQMVATVVWAAGAIVMLAASGRRWWRTRQLICRSSPASGAWATLVAQLSDRCEVGRPPDRV